MERLNFIGNNVYVIRYSDVGSELGKRTFEEAFGDTLDVDLGFTVGVEEPAVIEALSNSVPPPESSRVSRSDVEIPEFDLQSLLVPQEAIDKYKMCHARLKKELKLISLEDHVWTLKSFDNNNVGIVKLQCGECQKDFGGGSGDHNKNTIHNLFANFKKSHIMSNAHIRNWCRRKGIPWTEHPQSSVQKGKYLILTAEDHKRVVEDGMAILDMVNRDICVEGGPFGAIGDPEGDSIKSFWHKVRCKVCGDLFQLCPPKKNLAANLTNHVMGIKHVTKVEEAAHPGHLFGLAISTGHRGRPTTSSRNTLVNQNDLHNWFRIAIRFEGGCTETGGGASGNFFSILSFLCWGNWRLTCIYSNKSYDITGLLMDPMPCFNWVPEPHTKGTFMYNDKLHVVSGCFRHKVYKRFSSSGEPFTDFICSEYCNILQESDFRM
jgi:hypothetical protein